VSKLLGIKVSSLSSDNGGQPSTCVTVNVRGKGGRYYVTSKGILSYSGLSPTSYFELTELSSSARAASSRAFGATTLTRPTGFTIPSTPSVP
jgi:hypothetical protein